MCLYCVIYRCHALSVSSSTLHSDDADSTDSCDTDCRQYQYRNYTDTRYSIYVDIIRQSVRTCPQVSSKVEKPLNLPTTLCNATADGRHCKLKVTLYPQVTIITHCDSVSTGNNYYSL